MKFDNYSMKARLYPMVLMFLPFAIVSIAFSYNVSSTAQSIGSLGGAACLSFLLSQIGRDGGKKKEPALWRSWGGSPSVQILRISDYTLDTHTKQRYHKSLKSLCQVTELTTAQQLNYVELTDEVYKAWTQFLIGKTRDIAMFSLLYKENISYGFRRNLWGLKPYAIALIVAIMLGWYFLNSYLYGSYIPTAFPLQWLLANAGLLIVLLFWVFVVTKNWIKLVAFAYAERLMEACDRLTEQLTPIRSSIIKP